MAIAFQRKTASDEETVSLGESLGRVIRGGDVVLLDGPLGAGKTTMVRGIALGMGVAPGAVSSPTFVVVQEYARQGIATSGPAVLYHVDAYRLRGADDLDSLGWDRVWESVRAGIAAVAVEWAEKLGETPFKGAEAARVGLSPTGEESRLLNFAVPDSWRERPGFAALMNRKDTRCPVTGRPVRADCPTYPFADERARQADLYKWLTGGYRVSRPARGEDFEGQE